MKVILAQYAQKKPVMVWGTSNYVIQMPSLGSNKRITQTAMVGAGVMDTGLITASASGNQYYTPRPRSLRVDAIKGSVSSGLVRKLKHRGVSGRGVAVI